MTLTPLKNAVIILFYVTALASCSQANSKKGRQPISMNIRTDTAIFWNNFHNVQQLSKQLKLESFEDGFDSLQIRIWFDHSMAFKKHVIVIKRRNDEWKGRIYEMKVGYLDSLNYNIIEHYNKKDVKPVSGWRQFIGELYQNKIQELSGGKL